MSSKPIESSSSHPYKPSRQLPRKIDFKPGPRDPHASTKPVPSIETIVQQRLENMQTTQHTHYKQDK
ncbi:MAG: hypothetical protein S4CHLAM2_11300 [Chlamydiales bacterium]|nr:hypothetical protein [Chlamydiales bacterium]